MIGDQGSGVGDRKRARGQLPHLKLRAKDAEDVQVISAILQDAIAPVCDITYQADDKTFIMVVHRLRREAEGEEGLARICCAVNLRGVEGAQLHGFDPKQREQILDLLAAILEGKTITFIFAGDARIRLRLGDWSMILEDFGEPWPAHCKPCHEEGSGAGDQGSAKSA